MLVVGESSSFVALRSGLETSVTSAPPADLQEQMRNQMKDPAMRQVFSFKIYFNYLDNINVIV